MACLRINKVDIPEIPDAPGWLQSIGSTIKSIVPWVAAVISVNSVTSQILKFLEKGREAHVNTLIEKSITNTVKPDIKELTESIKELREGIWELKNKIK